MPPDSSTPQTNTTFPTVDHPIIVTAHSPRFNKKIFFAGLGLFVLIIGIIASVFLVQQRQQLQTQAWDCNTYDFNVSITGLVTVVNNSGRIEPEQKVSISINNNPVGIFDVPSLNPNQTVTITQIELPAVGGFSWSATGSEDCTDSGFYPPVEPSATPTKEPEPSETPTPSPSTAPTCVPRPACLDLTPPCEPADIGFCPATPTPVPSATPIPSPSATPNPTPTTVPGPSSTPTPGPTSPPTPGEPNACGGTCGSDANCKPGLTCYLGYCRNPNNPSSTTCTDKTPTPTTKVTTSPYPTPVTQLPQSGAIEYTWIISALGLILIGAGFFLAL